MPDTSRLVSCAMTLLLFWIGSASVHGSSAPPSSPEIYILAGQSNMSGRGLLEDLSEADRAPDPAILLYGNDGRLASPPSRWTMHRTSVTRYRPIVRRV